MKKMGRRLFLGSAVGAPLLAYGLHEVLSEPEPEAPVAVPPRKPVEPGSLNPKAPPPPLPQPVLRDPCPACGMACVDERSWEFLRQQTQPKK